MKFEFVPSITNRRLIFPKSIVLLYDPTFRYYVFCSNCCGYTTAVLGPDPFSGMINTGGSNQMNSLDCMDNEYDFANKSFGWGSTNTGVATLAHAYTNLVGVGGANGFASVTRMSRT